MPTHAILVSWLLGPAEGRPEGGSADDDSPAVATAVARRWLAGYCSALGAHFSIFTGCVDSAAIQATRVRVDSGHPVRFGRECVFWGD